MSSYKKPMKLNVPKNSKNFAAGNNKPYQRPERKLPEVLKKQVSDNPEQASMVIKDIESSN